MDLFDLFAKLSLDSSDYDRSLQNASSAAEKWATKFTMAAKAVGSAVSWVSKGIGSLASSAVKSYAQFEQLEGGIKTLFGTQGKSFEDWSKTFSQSSDSMQDYIDVARKVINGDFGVGSERRDLLAAAGYDPDTVQQMVNNLISGIDAASDISADTISANMQTAEEKYESLQRAQDQAMENARNAYMTAGMSANDYMEMVTSFAASLNQSLGGDTEKAVDVADMAIRDMSDNANKMGTDISSIQAAYQGFSKQNYTMLDNLKLGYGGTKTEMERLLKDAEKLTGVKYDINNLSDVYKAIHAIQKETGIAGATAEEAAGTISGSWNSVKASWSNVLTSLVTGGDFFDQSLKGLKDSLVNYTRNVIPAISGALNGIGALISDLAPVILAELPGLISDLLPGLIDAVISIMDSIIDQLPLILQALNDAIPIITRELGRIIPKLAKTVISLLTKNLGTGAIGIAAAFTGIFSGINKVNGVVNSVKTFGKSFGWIKDVLPKLAGFKTALIGAFGAAKTAIAGFASTVLPALAPILPIIAAVAAAVGLFALAWKKNWLGIGDTMNGVVSKIKKGFNGVSNYVDDLKNAYGEGGFSAVFSKIGEDASGLWQNSIKPWFDNIGTNIKTFFTDFDLGESVSSLGSAIGSKVSEWWTTHISPWFEGENGIGSKIKNFFTNLDLAESLTSVAGKISSSVSEWWTTHISPWFEGENGIGSKIKNFFSGLDLGESLQNTVSSITTAISGWWGTNISPLFEGEDGIGAKIKNFFSGLDLSGALQTVVDGIVTAVSAWWELYIKTPFDGIITFIKAVFSGADLSEALTAMVTSIKTNISSWWTTYISPLFNGENGLGSKLKNFFSQFAWGQALLDFVGGIKTGIGDIWTHVKDAFEGEGGLGAKIKNFFTSFDWGTILTNFVTGIGTAISGKWDSIKDTFTGENGFIGKVKSWFSEFDLVAIVTEFIQKIKDAIDEAWDSFKEWFGGKISGLFSGIKVPNWIKKLFGKGEGNAEDVTTMDEEDEKLVDMPENMLTLDYSDLEPIPDKTLASYQELATAINSINDAIGTGEEGSGGLLNTLGLLPAKFNDVLNYARAMAGYFGGGMIAAVNALLEHLCIATVDEEGNITAGGGNTLYTALGAVYGLFKDIYTSSQEIASYWTGAFITASESMRTEAGRATSVVEGLGAAAQGAANQFYALTQEIYATVDAYLALLRTKAGGGAGSFNPDIIDGKKASGGPVYAGQSYLVGEEGPEVFSPARTGYIIPNDRLRFGSPQISINFNGDVIGDEKSIYGLVNRAAKAAIRQEVRAAS